MNTQKTKIINKNIVISLLSDYSGCGYIRNIIPTTFINSIFGQSGKMQIIQTPMPIMDDGILRRTRAIFFQRTMGVTSKRIVDYYKSKQKEYGFKMVYDIDDFVWSGDDLTEEIPEYNFGRKAITKEVQETSIHNMKQMDVVCVSTQFLKDYICKLGIDESKIVVVHNSLPKYLWGNKTKPHITEKIEKPTILWSASPTHWHNENKLYGDMDNAWREWIIKNVNEDRINYIQMGGCPWFFEEIKDKIQVINWVDCLSYPNKILSLNADFGIAPLVPNYFNYSKSAIKYQEYCMSGIVGIGTFFDNGNPSPYDICVNGVSDKITVEDLDTLIFDNLCLPKQYNESLDLQYQQIINNHWYTESSGYINLLTSIL